MLPTTFPDPKEAGYIILAAVLILALLSIICVSALHMSTTEMKIATNELLYEKAFYTAEAGLQHLTEILRLQYVNRNSAILSAGGRPTLSFALQGALDSDQDGVGDLNGSVKLLDRKIDAIDLHLKIWNNDDGGGPDNDTDGLIYVLSESGGPRRALCRIEILLEGTISGESVSDYSAQAGGGTVTNFVSSDANAITSFTPTGLNAN